MNWCIESVLVVPPHRHHFPRVSLLWQWFGSRSPHRAAVCRWQPFPSYRLLASLQATLTLALLMGYISLSAAIEMEMALAIKTITVWWLLPPIHTHSRDLLLETRKAFGVLAPSTGCLCSISTANVTWAGSVRTALAGRGVGWILVGHKKHKLCCPRWHFGVFCYSPILTGSLLPAYPTGCFKRFGSLKGKAALAGNWTPDISVAAIPTRVITIYP